MPKLSPGITATLRLYNRCKSNHCLPVAGGVLDQPHAWMQHFDEIDEAVHEYEEKQREREMIERQKHELERKGPHGR